MQALLSNCQRILIGRRVITEVPYPCAWLSQTRKLYQQTFVDTYSKVALAKLHTTKTPITSADILNERTKSYLSLSKISHPYYGY